MTPTKQDLARDLLADATEIERLREAHEISPQWSDPVAWFCHEAGEAWLRRAIAAEAEIKKSSRAALVRAARLVNEEIGRLRHGDHNERLILRRVVQTLARMAEE